MQKKNVHRSTQRVVDILDNITQSASEGLTLTELAVKLDAPKSSLFTILHTLAETGMLSLDKETSKYRIGFKSYEVGSAYLYNGTVNQDILNIMRDVVKGCSETCFYAQLIDGDVFYLHEVDSPEPIRMIASPGRRLPAYSASIGKALLSNHTREELEAMYPNGLEKITANTITDMDVLYGQLEDVRRTGLAFEREESTPSIRCVAIPIRRGDQVVNAISVAMPIFRYTEEKEEMVIKLLKTAQGRLENIMDVGNGINTFSR